ncbi:MAG: type II secretion system protein GspE, partial [Halofilum sp. (in: g-proteobacteria)]
MAATATEAAGPSPRVSYSFARRNGVLLEERADGQAIAILRPDASPDAVLELRRATGAPIAVEHVSADDFGHRLTRHYEDGAGGALDAVDDLGDEADLASAAEALPEPEDLMESQDDAPIIRLINAILTE